MTRVEVGYFPDKRLKLLLRCWIGDKDFWYDQTTKSYTLRLQEDTILLAFETYLALDGYNIWKLRERRYHTD